MPQLNPLLYIVEAKNDDEPHGRLIAILMSDELAKNFVEKTQKLLDSHGATQPTFYVTKWIYGDDICRYRSTENDELVLGANDTGLEPCDWIDINRS